MRLLNVHDLELRQFAESSVPLYITASHRWDGAENETTLKDIVKKRNTRKSGYRKVESFANFIKQNISGIDWLWIDTCCVDQKSSREVDKAINSMSRWYRDAELCIAFLSDVTTTRDRREFRRSSWFRRGWTLQELLAPACVIFVTRDWEVIGQKGFKDVNMYFEHSGPSLIWEIADITGIPRFYLRWGQTDVAFPPELVIHWMSGRETTEEEDWAYCLCGLLNVSLSTRYGEGKMSAMARLEREVARRKDSVVLSSVSDLETFTCHLCPFCTGRKDCLIAHFREMHCD